MMVMHRIAATSQHLRGIDDVRDVDGAPKIDFRVARVFI
jgi:hypothetical protein